MFSYWFNYGMRILTVALLLWASINLIITSFNFMNGLHSMDIGMNMMVLEAKTNTTFVDVGLSGCGLAETYNCGNRKTTTSIDAYLDGMNAVRLNFFYMMMYSLIFGLLLSNFIHP
jgi:hypothetical protein